MSKSPLLDVSLGKRWRDTRLTLLERAGKSFDGRPYVRALCDCGYNFRVLWQSVSRGVARSCGCARAERFRQIAKSQCKIPQFLGKEYPGTRLTIVRLIDEETKRVECLCACGNTTEAIWKYVRNLKKKSCGCMLAERRKRAASPGPTIVKARKEKKAIEPRKPRAIPLSLSMAMLSQISGSRLTPLRAVSSRRGIPIVECSCSCGGKIVSLWSDIMRLKTRSCGCLRSEHLRRARALRHKRAA